MSKIFLKILFVLSLVACQKPADYVIVSGKIQGSKATFFSINGNDFSKEITMQADGSFSDTLRVSSNYYYFQATDFYVPVYVEQGKNLVLELNLNEKPAVVQFSGGNKNENVYLWHKKTISDAFQERFVEIYKKKVPEFEKELDELEKKYKNHLENSDLTKEFVLLEEKSIRYELILSKMTYEATHLRLTKERAEIPEHFLQQIAAVDLDNSSDFELVEKYRDLLVEDFFGRLRRKSNGGWKELAEYVNSLKSDNIKSFLAPFLANGISLRNSTENNELIFNTIKKYAKDENFVQKTEERYLSLENLKVGAAAPKFVAETLQGDTVSLADFKGKLIYIDVWATWCVPCLNEMPALEKLEKEYHNKDVVFVSISIDKKKQKWKSFLEGRSSVGVQLYAGSDSSFMQQYDIQSVPRFILIDKNGNMLDANTLRPSEPKLKELLNNYL